jgi:Flp pilus assembly protein TadG
VKIARTQGFRTPPTARRGAVAVELGLVLPLLVTLLLGVWDIGRLIDASQILDNAAREGGRCASTGKVTTSGVQTAVLEYLKQAGLSTTGVTVSVSDLTTSGNSDPTTATQLDQYQITVTMPSNNVRWIVMNNLIGSSSLTSTCLWNSMKDIPLSVSTTIPTN